MLKITESFDSGNNFLEINSYRNEFISITSKRYQYLYGDMIYKYIYLSL